MAHVQKKEGDNKDEYAKAQALFERLKEANGNVLVSKLSTYLKQQGMDDAWVAKAMQQIDVNGDNELTWAEFATKGIRIVHHLKLHADHVAKTGGAKAKPAAGASSSASASASASAPKKTTSNTPAAPANGGHNASEDLTPFPNARSTNIRYWLRQRTQSETAELIKAEAAHKAAPAPTAAAGKKDRKKKRFAPNKPTKDEKGVLRRLRKHDATKAPPYEKSLNEKYSLKKKPAPAKK